ncbi:UNVERIFIED_CONTAM: hypothetical protein FKN15_072730 [Acipenser sinensis]
MSRKPLRCLDKIEHDLPVIKPPLKTSNCYEVEALEMLQSCLAGSEMKTSAPCKDKTQLWGHSEAGCKEYSCVFTAHCFSCSSSNAFLLTVVLAVSECSSSSLYQQLPVPAHFSAAPTSTPCLGRIKLACVQASARPLRTFAD